MTRAQARAIGRNAALKMAATGSIGDGVEGGWYTDTFSELKPSEVRQKIDSAFNTNAQMGFDSNMSMPSTMNMGDVLQSRGQSLRPPAVSGSEELKS